MAAQIYTRTTTRGNPLGESPAPLGALGRLLRRLGDRLYRAEDAQARRFGWEITSTRCGLGRSYRDSRWTSP